MHLGLLNARHTAGSSLFGDGTYSNNISQLNHNDKAAVNGATDNNTWVANANTIPNGSIVRALSIYSTVAGYSQKLYILRDNGAYNYTTVVQLNITTDGAGWGYYALPTDYVVPATGRYVVGMHGSGNMWYTPSQAGSVHGAPGGLAVGSSATFTTDTNAVVALGYWAIGL